MKTTIKTLAALALPALLIGCFSGEDTTPPNASFDGMTIINQGPGLDRLDEKNVPIEIDSSVPGAMGKRSAAAKTLNLTLTAEIRSPVVNGDTLQATRVYLSGGFAYVSYNVQGSTQRGAVDIIQIKSGSNAELRSQVLFDSADVNSLYYDGDLYLAQGDARLGAVVEKIDVDGGKIVNKARIRTRLGSFVATSVATSGSKVWVTTGDNGGRLYTLDANLKKTDSSAVLTDARWVDYDGIRLVVAQGQPCRLQIYSILALLGSPTNIPVGGCNIPESKSTVRTFASGRALVAAGDSGVRIMNLANGAEIGKMPRVILSGTPSSETVTNAVDGSGTLIYASNGEAGIYAIETSQSFDLNPATTTLNTLGKLKLGNFQSANHVAYDGNTLVVAAGKGGVKIVSVDYK